ncbi:XRE family transcriptional regulator [Lacticaseibacillus brantae DSM 23927]|uniref:XRE family transcriptional regulator n=2 Tax=Lacticaseibacillus brantae TaxID=943673 RepID=A0A0R2B072_9LACO|nr:XRE family transcriptional regulator [Lacticaseibacillus brantae DSM 23927]
MKLMSKQPQVLQILGDKMRYYRRLKGFSQAELAQGICTQATISLIEKRNKVPSMNILMRLIARLGIQLEDVVVEHHDSMQQDLNLIDDVIQHGDYTKAQTLLAKVQPNRLVQADDQKRYYYNQGMVELFLNHAPDEAIYFFGRTLNPFVNSEEDLYGILATLGLGLAYAEKQSFSRAKVYIDQALKMLTHIPLAETKYLTVELNIYWNISRIYYQLGNYEAVTDFAQKGIAIAVAHQSLFLLDELYAISGRALIQLDKTKAQEQLGIALALAKVRASHQLATTLVSEMHDLAGSSETA